MAGVTTALDPFIHLLTVLVVACQKNGTFNIFMQADNHGLCWMGCTARPVVRIGLVVMYRDGGRLWLVVNKELGFRVRLVVRIGLGVRVWLEVIWLAVMYRASS